MGGLASVPKQLKRSGLKRLIGSESWAQLLRKLLERDLRTSRIKCINRCSQHILRTFLTKAWSPHKAGVVVLASLLILQPGFFVLPRADAADRYTLLKYSGVIEVAAEADERNAVGDPVWLVKVNAKISFIATLDKSLYEGSTSLYGDEVRVKVSYSGSYRRTYSQPDPKCASSGSIAGTFTFVVGRPNSDSDRGKTQLWYFAMQDKVESAGSPCTITGYRTLEKALDDCFGFGDPCDTYDILGSSNTFNKPIGNKDYAGVAVGYSGTASLTLVESKKAETFDFSVTVTPPEIKVIKGQPATFTVKVSHLKGEAKPVSLNGFVNMSTTSYGPLVFTVATPPFESKFAVPATQTQAARPGRYTVLVDGKSGDLRRSGNAVALVVEDCPKLTITPTMPAANDPREFTRSNGKASFRFNIEWSGKLPVSVGLNPAGTGGGAVQSSFAFNPVQMTVQKVNVIMEVITKNAGKGDNPITVTATINDPDVPKDCSTAKTNVILVVGETFLPLVGRIRTVQGNVVILDPRTGETLRVTEGAPLNARSIVQTGTDEGTKVIIDATNFDLEIGKNATVAFPRILESTSHDRDKSTVEAVEGGKDGSKVAYPEFDEDLALDELTRTRKPPDVKTFTIYETPLYGASNIYLEKVLQDVRISAAAREKIRLLLTARTEYQTASTALHAAQAAGDQTKVSALVIKQVDALTKVGALKEEIAALSRLAPRMRFVMPLLRGTGYVGLALLGYELFSLYKSGELSKYVSTLEQYKDSLRGCVKSLCLERVGVYVEKGLVRFVSKQPGVEVQKDQERIKIILTPTGQITPQGTEFTLQVGSDGSTTVTTHSGTVEVADWRSEDALAVSLGANRQLNISSVEVIGAPDLQQRILVAQSFRAEFENQNFSVGILSNSTVDEFNFSQPDRQIRFRVEGSSGTIGFSEVSVPNRLLSGQFAVQVDGSSREFKQTSNSTHITLRIEYPHSAKTITITGTVVIPEYPYSPLIVLAISIALLPVLTRKLRGSQYH